MAISLFGTIIAEVNEILMFLRIKSKGLDKVLESYLAIHPRYWQSGILISLHIWK